MVQSADQWGIEFKHKAISALFPYAVHMGRSGKQRMVNIVEQAQVVYSILHATLVLTLV